MEPGLFAFCFHVLFFVKQSQKRQKGMITISFATYFKGVDELSSPISTPQLEP